MLLMLVLMTVFGLALGTESSPYNWLMLAIVNPLSSVNYSILTFYMASAGARAFRARSPQAGLLLLTGIIVLLQQAPITGVYFPSIDPLARYCIDAFVLAISRMFMMSVAIGAIILGIRVLIGKESGILGFTEGGTK
jgi:hypothetical protein